MVMTTMTTLPRRYCTNGPGAELTLLLESGVSPATSALEMWRESCCTTQTKSSLAKSGQLEENLRVKVRHFYPQTE